MQKSGKTAEPLNRFTTYRTQINNAEDQFHDSLNSTGFSDNFSICVADLGNIVSACGADKRCQFEQQTVEWGTHISPAQLALNSIQP
jgi:hypothetical protein